MLLASSNIADMLSII
jgi:hypothetical protein